MVETKARPLTREDYEALNESLCRDPFHEGTTAGFFFAPGTMCNVHEDEQGPIMYVRGMKSLRIDVQFVDNQDIKRNMAAMLQALQPLSEAARQNGFSDLVFNTSNQLLKKFCTRRLGFEEVDGDELRLYL